MPIEATRRAPQEVQPLDRVTVISDRFPNRTLEISPHGTIPSSGFEKELWIIQSDSEQAHPNAAAVVILNKKDLRALIAYLQEYHDTW